jgi:hypothetical protein
MWLDFFRAIGRGLVAIIRVLLWEPVVAVVRAIFQGASDAIRRAMPLVIGAVALWGLLAYAPELLNLTIAMGVMLFALHFIMKGFRPPPKKK